MWSIVHVCRWWVQQLWGRGGEREGERERGGGGIEMSVYEFVCWERKDFPWVSMECDLVDQTWGVTSVFPLLSWKLPSTMLAALSLAMCSTKVMRGRRRTAGVVLSGFSVTAVALVFWSCSWTWSRHTYVKYSCFWAVTFEDNALKFTVTKQFGRKIQSSRRKEKKNREKITMYSIKEEENMNSSGVAMATRRETVRVRKRQFWTLSLLNAFHFSIILRLKRRFMFSN